MSKKYVVYVDVYDGDLDYGDFVTTVHAKGKTIKKALAKAVKKVKVRTRG